MTEDWTSESRVAVAWRQSRLRTAIEAVARSARRVADGSAVLGGGGSVRETGRSSAVVQAGVRVASSVTDRFAPRAPHPPGPDDASAPQPGGAERVRTTGLLLVAMAIGLIPLGLGFPLPAPLLVGATLLAVLGGLLIFVPRGADILRTSGAVRFLVGPKPRPGAQRGRVPRRETNAITWDHLLVGAAAAALVAGPLLRTGPAGPPLGIVAVLAVTGLLVRRWSGADRGLYLVLGAALLARLLLVGADATLGLFPKVDAVGYHFRASTLAEAWMQDVPWEDALSRTTTAYEHFIAPFYVWFGPSPLLARTVNAAFATAAVFNVFRIGREVFDRRSALFGAAVFALMPSIVRVHGEHLREAVMIFFLTEVLYLLLAARFTRPAGLGLAAVSAALVFLLRPQTFLVLLLPAVAAVLVWWVRPRPDDTPAGSGADRGAGTGVESGPDRHGRWSRRGPLLAGALAVIAGIVLLAGPRQVLFTSWLDPATITQVRDAWATGGSQYLSGVVFHSWLDVALFLPLGALYFLFTPFPGQVHTGLALAAAVENLLLFYPVTVVAVLAMRKRLGDARRAVLVLFLVLAALMFGLIEGNVGTALRHRAQFTWVLFLFAGPTLAAWWTVHAGSADRDPRTAGDGEGPPA